MIRPRRCIAPGVCLPRRPWDENACRYHRGYLYLKRILGSSESKFRILK
jgi:hypothetical protein